MTAKIEESTDIHDWITLEEAAARTGVSVRWVFNWVVGNHVKFIKPGKRHHLVYWPSVAEYRASMRKKKPFPVSQSTT